MEAGSVGNTLFTCLIKILHMKDFTGFGERGIRYEK